LDSDFYSDIKTALLSAVYPAHVTEFPNVPVVIDNGPFDRNNAPEVWAELEIKFHDSDQVGPSANPRTRQRGFVYLSVYSREGTGNKVGLRVLGWFAQQLGYYRSAPVQCNEPSAVPDPAVRGWHIDSLKVPFFADSQ
jgi:hypothetical protein